MLDGSAAGPDAVPVAPADLVCPGTAMHRDSPSRAGARAAAARNGCPFAPVGAAAAAAATTTTAAAAAAGAAATPPVRGPLARKLMESEANFPSRWGNTMLFAFAGHDTTGHTLTWLAFELAKSPAIQDKLTAEVDAFWAAKGDAPLE